MNDFPGLHKRGRVWWIDIRHNGRRYHESLKTRSREVAKKRYRKRRGEIELGVVPRQRRLVIEWLGFCLAASKSRDAKHKREVERINRLFIEDSGAMYPEDLDGSAAERWLISGYVDRHSRRGVISARSRKKYAQHLSQFGAYLVKHRKTSGLTENPFELLEFTCGDADRVYIRRHYKTEELFALLRTCPEYRGIVYFTAAITGLRRKELMDRKWRDLNLDDRTPGGLGWAHLSADTTKNKKARKRHPLTAALVDKLLALRAGKVSRLDALGRPLHHYQSKGTGPDDPVFVCVPGVDTLRRDLERAGVPIETVEGVLDFHSLRSAFAVLLEHGGVNLTTAQKLMRHSSPLLTANVYQCLEFSELASGLHKVADAADALAHAIRDGGSAVVKSVVNHRPEPPGIGTQDDAPEGHSGASNQP